MQRAMSVAACTLAFATAGVRVAVAQDGTVDPPSQWVVTTYPTEGPSLSVCAAGCTHTQLQPAIDAATPGTTIMVDPSYDETESIVLRAKGSTTQWIVIRSSSPMFDADGTVPPNHRVDGSNSAQTSQMPKIRAPNSGETNAIRTETGASHYRIVGFEISRIPTATTSVFSLVRLGSGSSATPAATHIVLDRVYVHGNANASTRKGVMMHGAHLAIVDSHVTEIHDGTGDDNAVFSANGHGPYKIANNRLEAAGEVILFGGATPANESMSPADIEIRGNLIRKPPAWFDGVSPDWDMKNLIEFKDGRRVLIEGNIIENTWYSGQHHAIVLTVRSQGGTCTWCTVQDVTLRNNIIRNAPAAVNILGTDYAGPSGFTWEVLFENNLFDNIGAAEFGGGNTKTIQLSDGPKFIRFEHNTFINVLDGGAAIYFVQPDKDTEGFVFRDNLMRLQNYGVYGEEPDTSWGTPTLDAMAPGWVFEQNGLANGTRGTGSNHPPGNVYLSATAWADQFESYNGGSGGDYRLKSSNAYAAAGNPDVGADMDQIALATTCTANGHCTGASPPTITTPLTAVPNPAEVGEPVTLSVTASDPDGDPLTYTWDFGDGTAPVQGSSDSVQHTYTAVDTFSATVTVSDGTASDQDTEDVSVVCSSCGTQTPFPGTPFAVPGTFEAEHFDNGGEGVAYHDEVPGNAGGAFRTDEDVDIIAAEGNATLYVINNFETGEWLEYTISVGASGTYAIELHVSSQFTTSGFHLEVDGAHVTGSVPVASTGNWSTFQWVTVSGVNLSAGQRVLRVHADQQYFDLDAIRITTQNATAGAHWRLDETSGTTAADATGNGHTGTLTSGPTWNSAGALDGALSFDGVDDHVTVPNPSALLQPTGAFAISAWVKYTSTDVSGGEVASMGDSYLLRVRPTGEVRTGFFNGATWTVVDTVGVDTGDGAWHHLVGQYTGASLQVYVDGVLKAEAAASGPIVYGLGTNFYIGRNGDGGTNHHFAGTIDDVRVFDEPLTAAEIETLTLQSPASAFSHWKLDETSGTTASDTTLHENHGSLANGPVWTSAGRIGGALTFDGIDDHVAIGSPSAVLKPTNAFAISAWVRYTTTAQSGEVATMGDSYLLRVRPTGEVFTAFYNGSDWTALETVGVNTNDGAWHHLVGQYDGSKLQVYVDGVLEGEVIASGSIEYSLGTTFYFGRNGQAGTHRFAGTIDQVRVYGRALSSGEVAWLAAEQ